MPYALTWLFASAYVAAPIRAQPISLSVKRAFAPTVVAGCSAGTVSTTSGPRDAAEARRAFAAGQELALQGDPRGAGTAFARASALDPTDDRIAYAFARALEEVNDSSTAVREYCRALQLLPAGRDRRDLRARIDRLTPRGAGEALLLARERFGAGLAAFDARRYEEARRAFDDAARALPSAAEAPFNRAIAQLQLDDRSAAQRDFTTYLTLLPDAPDRVLVQQSIDVLGRPHFRAGAAFTLGVLPGMGQLYTGRPARGLVVLALVAGATYASRYTSSRRVSVAYVDPNDVPVPYTEIVTERPYRASAIAAGAGLTLAAALEAAWFAKRGAVPFVIVPGGKGVGLAVRF